MGRQNDEHSRHLRCAEDNGYKWLVSNIFTEMLEEIIEHMRDLRLCSRGVKCIASHRSALFIGRGIRIGHQIINNAHLIQKWLIIIFYPSQERSYFCENLLTVPIDKPTSLFGYPSSKALHQFIDS